MLYFDRFDVCAAYYMFASLYHGGMGSKEYAIFTRLHNVHYKPAPSLSVESLSENARAIFDGLIERAGFEPYTSVGKE